MSIVYIVRPDQRGVSAYNTPGIEHSWTTPLRLDIFSEEQTLRPPAVQRCTVRPTSVCEHGWFCTDNRDVAVMVDELRAERPSVLAFLDLCAREEQKSMRHPDYSLVASHAVHKAADAIERGEHRREEGA